MANPSQSAYLYTVVSFERSKTIVVQGTHHDGAGAVVGVQEGAAHRGGSPAAGAVRHLRLHAEGLAHRHALQPPPRHLPWRNNTSSLADLKHLHFYKTFELDMDKSLLAPLFASVSTLNGSPVGMHFRWPHGSCVM